MKSDQLIEYNERNICLQNQAENVARRLVPDLFFFSEKSFGKALWQSGLIEKIMLISNFMKSQLG